MKLKIKICGLREAGNIREIASLNPDFMGFIFYPSSKRFVGENFDGEMLKNIPEHIAKVGVFVNESLEKVEYLYQKFGMDFVQLHGNEHPEYCQKLKEKNIKIIKAFSVPADFDAGICKTYESCCNYFLFDT
ncbi:MAG: phosphoribosylanthranilate isomerase, partial [Bacteroidota bacterium]|nr:phosphoribosylanthranilate isomerase [Bacteroidota bacterium]